MSLEKWAEYGWLKAEPTSRDEAAFSAARTAATLALRASGYRTSTQLGHHVKTIESLELTIKADSKMIQKMKTFSKKRNATSYDSAGNVSKQELELAIKTAAELNREVVTWLQKNHPELLQD
ncbi:MAG: hypothetical protein DMG55_31810 [Acidobacteria bacterium]|nr:MAG: hypothetical protein DMG55_31810 [Acidobacteriota bacterium]